MSKWYVPYDDDEKVGFCLLAQGAVPDSGQVRLRGEVHRLVAPRDQKYQSNFVEARMHAATGSATIDLFVFLNSFATTRLFTDATLVYSFVFASMQTTMSWRIWRRYAFSWKC